MEQWLAVIMTMTLRELAKMIINKNDYIFILVKGQKTDDTDFWAYIAIHPSKYEFFKIAEASGEYNLNEFGNIIRHGIGSEPPEADKTYMKQNFDFDETLEKTLKENL